MHEQCVVFVWLFAFCIHKAYLCVLFFFLTTATAWAAVHAANWVHMAAITVRQ